VNNKKLRHKLALACLVPVMTPGFIFYTLVHGSYAKSIVISIALIIGLYLFKSNYHTFKKSEGFLKRFTWSVVLVNVSCVIMTFAPEAKNAFAGAALFLFAPSMIFAVNTLTSSKPARRVVMYSKKGL
jgi:hypothetical protein